MSEILYDFLQEFLPKAPAYAVGLIVLIYILELYKKEIKHGLTAFFKFIIGLITLPFRLFSALLDLRPSLMEKKHKKLEKKKQKLERKNAKKSKSKKDDSSKK